MGDTGNFVTQAGGMSRTTKRLLLILAGLVAGLGGFMAERVVEYAWTTLDGKADQGVTALKKVDLLEAEVEHLEEGQAEIKAEVQKVGQAVIDTLYIRPAERQASKKPVLDKEEPE